MAEPTLPPDFTDLITAFVAAEVEFLVVGGYALALHGHPRFTKDMDVWVGAGVANLDRAEAALDQFGAPPSVARNLREADDLDVVWMGRPPLRIDLMKGVPGGDFHACLRRAASTPVGDVSVPFVSRADLIAIKLASGRPQDLLDVDALSADQSP